MATIECPHSNRCGRWAAHEFADRRCRSRDRATHIDGSLRGTRMTAMAQNQGSGTPDEGQVVAEKRPKLKKPSMYAVVILNDDYTPMEFVIWVLQQIFHKDPEEATRLMLQVHNNGRGVAGIFTRDVAATKATQVETAAKRQEHPLACIVEPCGT